MATALTPGYWEDNLRQAFLFSLCGEELKGAGAPGYTNWLLTPESKKQEGRKGNNVIKISVRVGLGLKIQLSL